MPLTLIVDEVGAIVFDTGHHSVKVGYAGEDQPKIEIPSVVAYKDDLTLPADPNKIGSNKERKYFVGPVSVHFPSKGKEVKNLLNNGMGRLSFKRSSNNS